MPEHSHEWIVHSTALVDPAILVRCACGQAGSVQKYEPDDWRQAFHAPSRPFPLRGALYPNVVPESTRAA